MKSRLWFFPLFFLSLFLVSATSIPVEKKSTVGYEAVSEAPKVVAPVAKHKLNFVDRLLIKYVLKKFKKAEDTAKADKMASTSLTFGIIAISTLLLGLFIPFVMLAALPTGIVAMVTGNTALKSGTTETGKAHTGKSLGLGSLIAFGALLLIALVLVATFANWM